MKCPYCGHSETRVADSRESDDGIRRRRECLSATCGRRFTTYERVQVAPLAVIKKDGRREDFAREKLLEGVRRACAKLPISASAIRAIVDEIESELHARGVAEVPSTEVGDLVMEQLRELNHTAYVRFASHYMDFATFEEWQQQYERSLAAAPRVASRVSAGAQPSLLPPMELSRLSTPADAAPERRRGRRPRGEATNAEPAPISEDAAAPEAAPVAPVSLESRRAGRRRTAP